MKFLLVEEDKKKDNCLAEDITLQDKHAVREFADECKVDGLPLMGYKEFSELLNEQGMKPNEELYQVYVDAYNNEEDTDYIEVIRKKFEKMSSNEIIDLLGIPNSSNIDSDSPMFLLPNGAIISVAQAGKLIGQELSDNIHSDMIYVILSAIAKKYNYDWDMDDRWYEDKKLSFLTYGLDWARLNCGETWAEKRFYCVLPNHMTSAQYRSLEKWLEWGADTGKEEVLVYVGSDEVNQTYGLEETFPEDIIKKIKRYYSSGRLYEDVNNKDLLSFIYENAPLQKEPYWWSTFILPDGRFVDILSLDGEDYGEHEDFYGWLYDNGYRAYEQDIVDGIGCIKLNVTYPYATCPSKVRPTPQQLRALEKWLDEISDTADFQIKGCEDTTRKMVHPVAISTQDYKIYDLDVTSSRDIIKAIQKSYSSGILESRKELKETMGELIKDFSKVGNPKNGDRLTIIDDKDREWNYVAYLWSAPGFTSGMAWKGQGGNPWVTDVAANPRAFNSEFPKGVKSITLNDMNEKIMTESIKPGDRVKMDYYAKPNNGATGTCKGRIGQLCSIEWDDGSKSKEITTYLTKIDGVNESTNNEELNNKLTPSQAAQAVKELKLKSNPNINVYIDECMQGIIVTFEGILEGGKKIILWESNILSTQEQIDTLPSMYKKQSDELDRLREVGYKGIRESNELEQRAKKHKKKSKGMGWHMAVNAGDVEKGIEVFNNSTSLGSGTSGGEGTAMGEALDQNTYYYDGPIYYDGRKIATKSDIYTTAKSINLAIRNILYKAARGDKELYHYDIVDHLVREVPKNETPKVRPKCQTCGYELNDMGDCPVCDYGEDDLLESLSSLEALWELSNLD